MQTARHRGLVGSLLVGLAALMLTGIEVQAAPFVPGADSEVLERLPEKTSPQLRQLKAMRAMVARDPNDLAQVAALARRYIEAARSEGDPRYLGYAEAVMKPWWKQPDGPTAALVLRATLRQSSHDFDAALADLDRVLRREPRNAQARLTRATVLTVQGRYAQARSDCEALPGAAPQVYATLCSAAIDSLTGKADEALRALDAAMSARGVDAGARAWGQTLLGEIGQRRDDASAEPRFREALRGDPNDPYLVGAFSDWLLDHERPREVVTLIPADTRIDPLLLRRALALTMLRSDDAPAAVDALRARVLASRARGDTVHQREEARYALALNGDPAMALELARRNFAVQREPADVRVLAEAALAARDAAGMREVREWLANTGLQYAAVERMLAAGAGGRAAR